MPGRDPIPSPGGPPPESASGASADLQGLRADLRRLVDERVVANLLWYRTHAAAPRRLFRTSGTLVILLSVSIPLVAVLDFAGDDLVLAAMALVIAALTGLNSFFRWETSWRERMQAELSLAHLLAQYDLRILEVAGEADASRARQALIEATRELLERAQAVTGAETEQFFSRVVWPQVEER